MGGEEFVGVAVNLLGLADGPGDAQIAMEAQRGSVRAGRSGAQGGDLADLVLGRIEAGGLKIEDGHAAVVPGVEQRGVGPQPARIAVVRSVDISHPPSLHDHLAGRQGRPLRFALGRFARSDHLTRHSLG